MIDAWIHLRELALEQAGFFSTAQAEDLGVYSQLLSNALKSERIERVHRGVYRFVPWPRDPLDSHVALWLWSDQEAVFSHASALVLHGLGDGLPNTVDVTLPPHWKRRVARRTLPAGVRIHLQELPPSDVTWIHTVPVTTPGRSILDYARDDGAPDIAEAALREAVSRGMLDLSDMVEPLQEILRQRNR